VLPIEFGCGHLPAQGEDARAGKRKRVPISASKMWGGVERLTLDVTRTVRARTPRGARTECHNQEPGRTSNKEGESGRCYLLWSPESSGIGIRDHQPALLGRGSVLCGADPVLTGT
jgi:hypothetical protein